MVGGSHNDTPQLTVLQYLLIGKNENWDKWINFIGLIKKKTEDLDDHTKFLDYFLQAQNETETRLALSKLAVRTHKTSKVK